MLLLLSGEGATDLGRVEYGFSRLCGPGQWCPGPISLLVDQLFKHATGYSAIDSGCAYFLHATELHKIAQRIKNFPPFRGKGQNHYHRRGTQALASAALALSEKNDRTPVIAVYFRDCGGSNSSSLHWWEDLYKSMTEKSGFQLLGLATGVPMIPKPISEAWLICALKIEPYINCQELENETGSPHASRPLKDTYRSLLARRDRNICDLIKPVDTSDKCVINALKIDMNSFNTFKRDFSKALTACRTGQWITYNRKWHNSCVNAASDILFAN
jgi:hypothetical protein